MNTYNTKEKSRLLEWSLKRQHALPLDIHELDALLEMAGTDYPFEIEVDSFNDVRIYDPEKMLRSYNGPRFKDGWTGWIKNPKKNSAVSFVQDMEVDHKCKAGTAVVYARDEFTAVASVEAELKELGHRIGTFQVYRGYKQDDRNTVVHKWGDLYFYRVHFSI